MKRLVLAAALVVLQVPEARAQFSPGPLSRFHESLEGARSCRRCHEAGKGVTPQLCLTCHTALAQRIAAGAGLHARSEYRDCERCHIEHQGRGFELVFWGKEGRAAFDHAETGFPLQGGHAGRSCESCHDPKRIGDPTALSRGGANLARTLLGLSAICSSCHADPHRGQFAPRGCSDCHGQDNWKPAARFDHGRSDFPLTGRHVPVACARCHPAQPGAGPKFKGISHQTCAGCHQDPHGGRLGPQCASCHTSEGWSRIEPGRFDHEKTRFPLTGRHPKVACARCHATEAGGGMKFRGTAFQTCASCHRDPHAGRLGAQCASCHTTEGWGRLPSDRFDHDLTRFALRGRHASVDCKACHRPGQPLTLAHGRCADCHADSHAGQFAKRPDRGRCESCHDVDGWKPPRFSVEDHARSAYPLSGAHLAVPCDACHRKGTREPFRFASTRCADCHQDPHRGGTARWGACETCHQTSAWGTVSFDHARTAFRLEEGHARLACRSCHPAEKGALALAGRPTECAGCHKDPHGGQFARGGRTDCARCHTAAGWGRFRFDHDRETSFPLVGAHRTVSCATCHRRQTPEGVVMRYSGLGKACTDCHVAPVAPSPEGGGP